MATKLNFSERISQNLRFISNTRNSNNFKGSSIINGSKNFNKCDLDPTSLTIFKVISLRVCSILNFNSLFNSIVIFDYHGFHSFSWIFSILEFKCCHLNCFFKKDLNICRNSFSIGNPHIKGSIFHFTCEGHITFEISARVFR